MSQCCQSNSKNEKEPELVKELVVNEPTSLASGFREYGFLTLPYGVQSKIQRASAGISRISAQRSNKIIFSEHKHR